MKDKIINHVVTMHVLSKLERYLIDANVATRKNKESYYAFNLIKKYINKLKNSNDIYILKIDISKYFYNIDHNILKQKLKKKISDKYALELLFHIIDSTNEDYINTMIEIIKRNEINKLKSTKLDSNFVKSKIKEINSIPFYKEGKGLPIGNMSSQFMAIFYLNDIDHYIKEVLKHKYYIRYMDDLIIFDTPKKRLDNSKIIIEKLLESEKLKINNKSRIYNIKYGFEALGYRFKLMNNRLIIKYNIQTIRGIERKLRCIKNENYDLYYKSIRSYKGYFNKSNSKLKYKYIIKESNMYDKYNNLKKDYKEYLIFIKNGNFYSTYDEDALIMNYLFEYKIVDKRVRFPLSIKNKIIKHLEDKSINFVIVEGNNVFFFEHKNNSYINVLGDAYDMVEKEGDIKHLVDIIKEKINENSNNYEVIYDFLDNM